MTDDAFRKLVLGYSQTQGRHDLPWRKAITPYRILVSEVMLQQTQVSRVIEKYETFLSLFPTFRALAVASTANALKAWQGLGYNRRALALQRCAQTIQREYRGRLPKEYNALLELPGIGPYTAGAIMAFAFDAPVPIIETNIRRVYLHHFFPDQNKVSDDTLIPLIARHVSQVASARQWYAALMDYGSFLAQNLPNPNRRSKHYTKQAPFQGSLRQVRGGILRHLTAAGPTRYSRLVSLFDDERARRAIGQLEKEGFLRITGQIVCLAE